MRIGAPKEVFPGENRVAMMPDSALALRKLVHACFVEAGAGEKAGFSDAAYEPGRRPERQVKSAYPRAIRPCRLKRPIQLASLSPFQVTATEPNDDDGCPTNAWCSPDGYHPDRHTWHSMSGM